MSAMPRRVYVRWAGLAILAVAASAAVPGQARAQFGVGFGGFGFGFNTRPMSVENIYNRADMAGGHAFATRHESLSAPYTPRDMGWIERNSAESRASFEARAARERRQSQQAQQAAAAPTVPALPIVSFFDRYERLVWPADAPVAGDLQAKRDTSDKASKVVMEDVKARGFSSLGTVTDARDKLLDYGRPALKSIRETSSHVIAENFHAFLMSLYESLGQSATPAPNAPAPTPNPNPR